MPDLITHTVAAYMIRSRKIKVHNLIIYLIGAMLPDLATRPFMILVPKTQHFFQAFHTPVALALIIYGIVQFFDKKIRLTVARMLSYGTLTHLFLDMFQDSVADRGYGWFFPFSYLDFRIGLFWPEDSVAIVPILLLVFFIDFFYSKYRNKKLMQESAD